LLQPLGVKSRIQNFDEADGKIGTDFHAQDTTIPAGNSIPQLFFNRRLPMGTKSSPDPAARPFQPAPWISLGAALFLIYAIEKPAFGYPPVSGIFVFYAVHIPDNVADAHRNEGHTNYRLGWALSRKQQ
jgi:hypothetical protein